MYWGNFIHIYQPPTQKEIWIKRITNESYRKIFSGLVNIKKTKLTVNINGILCEFLDKYGGQDVLENIKTLLKNGSIELTGSAKYHAFLPLLPEDEIERQIILNEEILKKYFGESWKKSGFFSPEMAYSKKVAKIAKKLGYKWMIIDELAFPGKEIEWDKIYRINGLDDFYVFFRERKTSFTILSAQVGSVPAVLRMLGDRIDKNEYLITAMDGETFGHHRPGLETLLFDLMKEPKINSALITELIEKFPQSEVIEPRNSTWAVTKQDLEKSSPYNRWNDNENIIQQKQWQLTDLAIEAVRKNPDNEKIRLMLDEALHSDQYWWSSARPWWSLEMIERGAYELRNIIFQSEKSSEENKETAQRLYSEIIFIGFEWQRSGLVDEMAREEDEEILARRKEKESFTVTKKEYQEMIKILEEQMHLAAKSEEYHRAAMIKDRIRELKEEVDKLKE